MQENHQFSHLLSNGTFNTILDIFSEVTNDKAEVLCMLSVVHNYDWCDWDKCAISCNFVFTIVTATVMQLRPEINMFISLQGCTRVHPITVQLSVWAWSTSCGIIVYCYFHVFRLLIKVIYCLLSYFYLTRWFYTLWNLNNISKWTLVNKNMTILWRHWVTDRFCHSTLHGCHKAVASQSEHRRSHITVIIVNNALWTTIYITNEPVLNSNLPQWLENIEN